MLGHLLKRTTCYTGKIKPEDITLRMEYRKLWGICKPQLKKYIVCGGITLLHAATFMYLPHIYDDINSLIALNIDTTPQGQLIEAYLLKIGKWAGIFGALGTLTYLRRYQFLDVSNKISVRFRTVLYNHILASDLYRRPREAQACVHHLVTDVKSVSEFTGEVVFMGVRGICFLLGGTGCLLYYSPYLSLISVAIMSVFNLLFRKRNTLLKRLKEQENKSLIQITEFVAEKFHSLRLIKISNTERFERYQFARELIRFYEYSKNVSKANGLNYGFLEGLGLFSLFSVAACGALLISLNVTHFSLIASSTYALYVALGFRSIISFNTELMKMMAIYANIESRVGSVHDHELYKQPFVDHCLADYQLKIRQLEQQRYEVISDGVNINITNLYFSYINEYGVKEKTIYQNFNLYIKPGSVVALVGPSGSGKSTLLNILSKLQEPEFGKVLIDGQDVVDLDFKDIQRMTSYVTQEVYLFKGSFRDNIRYGNQHFDTSDQRLKYCLEMTNAWEFVESKGGLDGLVHEKGGNLSGGEKQRLALARALVKHPCLLLLDEGTSGIDSHSEQIIIDNLSKHRGDMTTIIITHKLEPFQKILTDTITLER